MNKITTKVVKTNSGLLAAFYGVSGFFYQTNIKRINAINAGISGAATNSAITRIAMRLSKLTAYGSLKTNGSNIKAIANNKATIGITNNVRQENGEWKM